MDRLEDLRDRVRRTFEDVHRRAFLGDPAANPRLRVEVVGAAMAGDTPVLVLITPWTLNGMAFPPDGRFPERLTLEGRTFPVHANALEGVGDYRSVNLVPDVSSLPGPGAARQLAEALAGPFRDAVARAREQLAVPDPGRRRLLRP